MLKARVATAIVLLGVFLSALILLPTRQFALLVGVVVATGAYEWSSLAKTAGVARVVFAAFCLALFAAAVWGLQAVDPSRPGLAVLFAAVSVFWIVAVPFWLARGVRFGSRAAALAVGVLVVVPAGLSVVSLHSVAPHVLLMFLALIWVADISAYFAGRAFGRHKLAPAISPGKSWEGVAGALAATMIYAIICAMLSPLLDETVRGGLWVPYLAIAAALCLISVVGDLFESAVKRQAQVKDSGTLLPGHGGVLDRIDSITSTLPVAALLFYLLPGNA